MATDPIRIEFFRKLEAKLATLPGVEQVALATSIPIFSYTGDRQILTEGQTPGDAARLPAAYHVMVTPSYFATMGIPLLEGRLFPADITAKSPRVIVVNERLARQLWPGRSAIGQRLGSMDSGKPYWAEVIGVVRDVDTAASTSEPSIKLHVYKPLVHEAWSHVHIIVKSAVPATLADPVRRTISEIAPDLATSGIGTVREIVDWQQHNLVLAAKTLTAFAVLGMLLAAVGLYGVISNLVAQRTGEFGIRLALGARPADVLSLVLKHGVQLTAIGLLVGAGGAYGLGRILASMMPRVAVIDPLSVLSVAAILFVVATLACWLPARRATKVNPLDALRAE
jgi:predicted permease